MLTDLHVVRAPLASAGLLGAFLVHALVVAHLQTTQNAFKLQKPISLVRRAGSRTTGTFYRTRAMGWLWRKNPSRAWGEGLGAHGLEADARLAVVGAVAPLAVLGLPRAGNGVLAPHHAGLGAFGDGDGVERQLATADAAPAELGLADHLDRVLVEAVFVQVRVQRAEAAAGALRVSKATLSALGREHSLGIAAAVVGLDRPCDLVLRACRATELRRMQPRSQRYRGGLHSCRAAGGMRSRCPAVSRESCCPRSCRMTGQRASQYAQCTVHRGTVSGPEGFQPRW